jgi:hypothetical protein
MAPKMRYARTEREAELLKASGMGGDTSSEGVL